MLFSPAFVQTGSGRAASLKRPLDDAKLPPPRDDGSERNERKGIREREKGNNDGSETYAERER